MMVVVMLMVTVVGCLLLAVTLPLYFSSGTRSPLFSHSLCLDSLILPLCFDRVPLPRVHRGP